MIHLFSLTKMSVSVVAKNVGALVEGPHWDDASQTLYYVDIVGDAVYRYDPATDTNEKVVIGEHVGCVVPSKSGKLVVTGWHRYAFLDWRTGALQTIQEVDADFPDNLFNDGKCDAAGRFWAGSVGPDDPATGLRVPYQGSLYCLHPDKTVTKHAEKLSISNGITWSHDNKTMYYIDSMAYGLDAFDYDLNTGNISNRRRLIDISPEDEGYVDGMCIDEEGMLWIALYRSRVTRYNPNTGEKLQTVQFPAKNITSCCFGGPHLDELYVTSSSYNISPEDIISQPLAGSLFKVTGLGVRGCKMNSYGG